MKTSTFGMGLACGAVIGAAAGMAMDLKKRGGKHHSSHNTFRSIGSMIDGVISSL